jgi:hypothetical protein
VLWLRARAERLTRDTGSAARPSTILHDVVGLQAQVWSAAALGMRARSAGLDARTVDSGLRDERAIVRTWLMRGTLHVVAAEDVRWLLHLLGPVLARAGSARHAQLGLDDDLQARGLAAIRKILSGAGPLTRYELVDQLRKQRVVLDPKTQAPIHLIGLAALQGILCLGPARENGDSTYVLLDDWVDRARMPSRETALSELAHRYLAAFGPATVEDLSSWSGLSMSEARSAINAARAGFTEVSVQGRPGFVLKQRLTSERIRTDVRLLPAFDTYLLGYRGRDLAAAPLLQRRLQRGGGWLHPAVVVNGRAVAAWTMRRTGFRGRLTVEPFEGLAKAVAAGVEGEVADIARFLAISVQWEMRGRLAAGPSPAPLVSK